MYQIFVVEDEILIRQSIREMIEGLEGPYVFCGEATDGEMALSMMQDLMPDILLTDIRMPFLDGLELIRHAKAMMPWLKILIISGYDDFEFARRAIGLGVDQYLLKPIRSGELASAIHGVARQIERAKAERAAADQRVPEGFDQDELHHALYQHYMQQLFFGGASASHLLERAGALGLDVIRAYYQVILFALEGDDGRAGEGDRSRLIAELLHDRQKCLYHFNGSDRLVLLVFARSQDELNDLAYRMIPIVWHELSAPGTVITTVVGNSVERLSAVKDACAAADAIHRKMRSVSAGQVIDINDTAQITADIVNYSGSFGELFEQKLLDATVEEVPELLRDYLSGPDSDPFNSMLYRYYTLVDILKTAVHIVSAAKPDLDPKDIAARLSNAYDIFVACGQRDTFEKMALSLLTEAVRLKQENLAFIRYSHVISKAEKYVSERYFDPNISLISVAAHVGMSAAHFSTIFSQTLGITFIAYLTKLRIDKAKEYLSLSDMKLSTIATEIGYNEPNYFSHVFKKSEGITPKEFRNRFLPRG